MSNKKKTYTFTVAKRIIAELEIKADSYESAFEEAEDYVYNTDDEEKFKNITDEGWELED